jgi:hypothetical protein
MAVVERGPPQGFGGYRQASRLYRRGWRRQSR